MSNYLKKQFSTQMSLNNVSSATAKKFHRLYNLNYLMYLRKNNLGIILIIIVFWPSPLDMTIKNLMMRLQ